MGRGEEVLHVSARLSSVLKPIEGSIIFYCDECNEAMTVSPASLEASVNHKKDGHIRFMCLNCAGDYVAKSLEKGDEIEMADYTEEQLEEFLDALKKAGNKAD